MTGNTITHLLSELIAIPSLNPEDTKDPALAGELRIAEFIGAYLEAKGFDVDLQDRESGRPNVICSYGPEDARKTVVFESHLDTVGVEGMTYSPFEAVIEDGKLYGRGSCDTKGPMAVALIAFTPEVLEGLARAGIRIVFVGAMGEEKGNIGAERLVESGFKCDQAIILEPTELQIIHAHKGALWFKIELRGKAGHGSDPARGVNAITAMSEVIGYLQEATQAAREQFKGSLLDEPTLNIGKISGGAAINVVADKCVIEVDRRILPDENGEEIIERTRAFLDQMQKERRIVSFELRIVKAGKPFETSANSEIVDLLVKSCQEVGLEPRKTGAAWYSDAGPLSRVCDEVVVFGPGSIRQAHTVDEYIEIAELENGRRVFEAFLGNMAAET